MEHIDELLDAFEFLKAYGDELIFVLMPLPRLRTEKARADRRSIYYDHRHR